MRQAIATLAVLVLCLSGCARHKRPQNVQDRTEEQPLPPALPQTALTQVASSSTAPDPSPVLRPSPFLEPRAADRFESTESSSESAPSLPVPAKIEPQAIATSSLQRETKPPASSAKARKNLKPFVLKTPEPMMAQSNRDRLAILPGPPALPLTASTAIPPAAAIGRRACCLGTAVTEPAKPAKLRRMLQRVPGLRRVRPEASTEEGYVAARPARQITMVLTPETRAELPEGRMDLKATVDESGRVTRVELLSPKVEELVRLSSYAANDWPFTPARLNDRRIPSEVILHFNFGN